MPNLSCHNSSASPKLLNVYACHSAGYVRYRSLHRRLSRVQPLRGCSRGAQKKLRYNIPAFAAIAHRLQITGKLWRCQCWVVSLNFLRPASCVKPNMASPLPSLYLHCNRLFGLSQKKHLPERQMLLIICPIWDYDGCRFVLVQHSHVSTLLTT